MNKLLTLFFPVIILILLSACSKKYTQVWVTKSPNTKVKQGFYIFENDTIKITYNFWGQNGIMSYEVYNKLEKPIYIDWKKSSYIVNSTKLDYWQDEEKIITSSTYQNYLNKNNASSTGYGVSISKGKVVREERITFIPPKSNYYRTQFCIAPNTFEDIITEDIPFDSINTPIRFRNFITYSTNEKFDNEDYINNDFYVSQILNKKTRLDSLPTTFYINYQAKYREIHTINYPNHIISLSATTESAGLTSRNIGMSGLGLTYEYVNKSQRLGINIGNYYFRDGSYRSDYIGNMDLKVYLGKNNGQTVRFFVGPSIVGCIGKRIFINPMGPVTTTFKGAAANCGLNITIKEKIVLNTGFRVGYGNAKSFFGSENGFSFGSYFSLGYGF